MTELTHIHLPRDEEEIRTPELVQHRELTRDLHRVRPVARHARYA